jgi:hypothetical protein
MVKGTGCHARTAKGRVWGSYAVGQRTRWGRVLPDQALWRSCQAQRACCQSAQKFRPATRSGRHDLHTGQTRAEQFGKAIELLLAAKYHQELAGGQPFAAAGVGNQLRFPCCAG